TALRNGCSEYRVEHPRWKIWNATSFELNADVAALYGKQFAETLNQPTRSAFIADGSPITVHKREILWGEPPLRGVGRLANFISCRRGDQLLRGEVRLFRG